MVISRSPISRQRGAAVLAYKDAFFYQLLPELLNQEVVIWGCIGTCKNILVLFVIFIEIDVAHR